MTFKTDNETLEYIKHTLEPIVDLDAGNILSFEVISFSGNRTALNEDYFCHAKRQDLVSLFMRQLEFFQKLAMHDRQLYHTVFINVDPILFSKMILWEDFLPFAHQFNINIEFDSGSIINPVSAETANSISRLRALGVKFWLRNADDAIPIIFDEQLRIFDGIKINKYFFWQCFSRNDTAFIKQAAAIWGNESIIVAGVENRHHLSFLKAQGLVQGQGFHWRARLLRSISWH